MTQDQRRQLLGEDYGPLDFDDEPGFDIGARYVLGWGRGQPVWEDGYGVRCPRVAVWFVTVSSVQRHRKGFWRVRVDVTDNRDPDLFLRRIGGQNPDAPSSFDELQAGALPDAEWLAAHSKMVASFWTRRRLERHVEERRERGRSQGRRWAA